MRSSSDSQPRYRGLRGLIITAAIVLGSSILLSASASVWASSGSQSGPVDPNAPEMATAIVNGTGEEITYDVVDGMAVLDNDILLGTHEEVQQNGVAPMEMGATPTCPEGQQCGVIETRNPWPNGVIPYALAAGTGANAATAIADAITEWETKTAIDFVERTNEDDYVVFQGTGNGNTCSSFVGRVGGPQPINYAGSGRGCLVHEIGHAVGLYHEHNRNDRDQFIEINFNNVAGNAASQFRIAPGSDVGEYDFGSAMHYTAFAFALDPSQPVIIPRDPNIPLSAVGGNDTLTTADVQAVEAVYGANDDGTPPPPDVPDPNPNPDPPQPPDPGQDQLPVVEFLTMTDGGTIPSQIEAGGLQVGAYDPNVGTADGDGIRLVTLMVSDPNTGELLAAGRDLTAPFSWGAQFQSGRSYTFTAFAAATPEAGGGWSQATVTVTAQ